MDDGIIPEKYEEKTGLLNEYIDVASLLRSAPGIKQELYTIANADQNTYYNNIGVNGETYFHFKLMDLFQNKVRSFSYDSDSGKYKYSLGYSDYKKLYKYYFKDYLGLSTSDYSIGGANLLASSTIRKNVINLVKQGIPVRLSIKEKSTSKDGHCVIAYDYDATNDKLYCNFGWGSGSTHVTIESKGYTYYNSYTYIKLNTDHVHTNNYFKSSGNTKYLCPCNLVIPNSIECAGDYALDVCPTFTWGTLITEKWFQNIYHEFSILDANRHAVFTNHILGNQYKLTADEWKKVIELTGTEYYVYIGIGSDIEPYWDDYYCTKLFEDPTEYAIKLQVKPNEWGFESRYWFANEGIRTTNLALDGLNITTKRLRCGYIENSYVILSPRRENAGSAYFEMSFDNPVYAFMYGICLWSGSEYLDGTAIIEVKDANGIWTQKVDILMENTLNTRTKGLNRYIVECPMGIYGIRFSATATATGDNNKGRLCIDDLVFCPDHNYTPFITTKYEKTTV